MYTATMTLASGWTALSGTNKTNTTTLQCSQLKADHQVRLQRSLLVAQSIA